MFRGCSLVAWFRFVFNECRFLLIQRNRRNYFATHKKSSSDDKQTFNTRRRFPYTCLGRSHSKCSKHEHWSLFNVCMATRSFSLHRFLFLFFLFLPFIVHVRGILLKNSSLRSWLPIFEDIKPFRCQIPFSEQFSGAAIAVDRRDRILFFEFIFVWKWKMEEIKLGFVSHLQHHNKTIQRIRVCRGCTISNWTNCHICRPKWIVHAPKPDFK